MNNRRRCTKQLPEKKEPNKLKLKSLEHLNTIVNWYNKKIMFSWMVD